jgi:hypothetical protein
VDPDDEVSDKKATSGSMYEYGANRRSLLMVSTELCFCFWIMGYVIEPLCDRFCNWWWAATATRRDGALVCQSGIWLDDRRDVASTRS